MCGIAGWVGRTDSDRPEIEQMLEAIRHRGPDEGGHCSVPNAVLGSRRLSIIDLAGGRQPIANESKTMWIVCNGEIYNYKSLRSQLIQQGHTFSTQSDTEVILHLYEQEGEKCVQRLQGMFAFAIWDSKARRLFAARDHLGQKPFFYFTRGQELLFGSEIKALLEVRPQLAELNAEALDQYLALRIIAPPRSMFREIRKLPPAHFLKFDFDRGLEIVRYWDLDYEPKHQGSEEDLLEELTERVLHSLRSNLVSDVTVGAFLSGGLDSTMIVAMLMKHVSGEPVPTFSMGFDYGAFDERPYAKLVAEKYGTVHHERELIPSLAEELPNLVWHLDEPSDPLSICSYRLAKFARGQVKAVVGGDGGDELFAGYDRYYGNKYASHYAMVPGSIRRHFLGPLLNLIPDGSWYRSKSHQLKWLHQASFLTGARRYARTLGYFYFNREWRTDLYGPRLRNLSDSFDPEASICDAFDEANAQDPIDRMLYADSRIRLPDHSVMILDRTTMAHGLEARSPFLDHELAEFCARLPVRMKVRGRSLRYAQRRLAERYLPKEVLDRPKQGFSSPLPYLLKDEYSVLRDLFLRDSQLAQDEIWNQKSIDRLMMQNEEGKQDHGNRLWLLLNAEIWYRLLIQGVPRPDMVEQIKEAQTKRAHR